MALRTLRQVAKVVGETEDGEPIVEVRSIRLVLNDDAGHFNRLLSCSKCGRDAPGSPVCGPGDLDHRVNAVICKNCVRFFTPTRSSANAVVTESASQAAPPVADQAEATDDPRPTTLEGQISDLAKLLVTQRDEQGPSLEVWTPKTEVALTALATIAEELARRQEELSRALDGAGNRGRPDAEPGQDLESRIEAAMERRMASYEAGLGTVLAGRVEAIPRASERRAESVAENLAQAATTSSARLETLEEQLNGTREDLTARLTSLAEAQSERLGAIEARVKEVDTFLERLQVAVDAEVVRRPQDDTGLPRRLDALAETLERRVEEAVQGRIERIETLERQAEEAGAALAGVEVANDALRQRILEAAAAADSESTAREAAGVVVRKLANQQAALRTAFDASVEELRRALEAQADKAGAVVAQVESDNEQLLSRLRELERAVAAESAARDDLARKSLRDTDLLKERLTRLAGAAEGESRRGQELGSMVQDLTKRVEDGERELRAALDAAVERQAGQAGVALSEVRKDIEGVLERLQELTAGLEAEKASRDTQSRTMEQAKEELGGDDASRLTETMEPLRREMRTALSHVPSSSPAQSADEIARIEALEHAVAQRDSDLTDLFDLQAALDAGMGRLRAELSAARGALDVSSLGPLRSDVKAIQKQIAAQNKALVALKRSVGTLRRTTADGATLPQKKGRSPAK